MRVDPGNETGQVEGKTAGSVVDKWYGRFVEKQDEHGEKETRIERPKTLEDEATTSTHCRGNLRLCSERKDRHVSIEESRAVPRRKPQFGQPVRKFGGIMEFVDSESPTPSIESIEIVVDRTKPLKSALRSNTTLRMSGSTVKFVLPADYKEDHVDLMKRASKKATVGAEDEDGVNGRQGKCKRFCASPVCRLIACIIFCVLLPCFLVYPTLFYLYKSDYRGRVFSEDRKPKS